jgi:hypothetical protein
VANVTVANEQGPLGRSTARACLPGHSCRPPYDAAYIIYDNLKRVSESCLREKFVARVNYRQPYRKHLQLEVRLQCYNNLGSTSKIQSLATVCGVASYIPERLMFHC